MKRIVLVLSFVSVFLQYGICQVNDNTDKRILFRGLIIDATTFSPISNSQIMINREFTSLSGTDGTFSFFVNRRDTVTFRSLGYKPSMMMISDTLHGEEYVAGIFMNTDTVSIGEVVIIPGYRNLKSDILNARTEEPANMSNARYNVAVSAYQGKNGQNVLGDPQDNYSVINQRQKTDAFEKGGIPSNNMVGLNALILIPAAYLLFHGSPEIAPPMKSQLTDQEINQVRKKYLEKTRQKK